MKNRNYLLFFNKYNYICISINDKTPDYEKDLYQFAEIIKERYSVP